MLSGKVALITGASSGIGAVTAEYFAKVGIAGLCITGRKEEALLETSKKCSVYMPSENILSITGDLSGFVPSRFVKYGAKFHAFIWREVSLEKLNIFYETCMLNAIFPCHYKFIVVY